MRRRDEGFTLIELLIVVAIIGILAAIAIPNLMTAMQKTRMKRTMADMRTIGTAWEARAADTNVYNAAGMQRDPAPGDEPIPVDEPSDNGEEITENVQNWLQPTYIKTMPTRDGWGAPFYVLYGEQDYVIVSLGADGVVDTGRRSRGATSSFDNDIVFLSGSFYTWTEMLPPANTDEPRT